MNLLPRLAHALLASACVAAAAQSPSASPRTGRDLKAWAEGLERFRNPQDFADAGKLHGYVLGIADSLSERRQLCFDDRVTTDQMVAATLQYLKGRADRQAMPAQAVVAEALRQKYACGG